MSGGGGGGGGGGWTPRLIIWLQTRCGVAIQRRPRRRKRETPPSLVDLLIPPRWLVIQRRFTFHRQMSLFLAGCGRRVRVRGVKGGGFRGWYYLDLLKSTFTLLARYRSATALGAVTDIRCVIIEHFIAILRFIAAVGVITVHVIHDDTVTQHSSLFTSFQLLFQQQSLKAVGGAASDFDASSF